jgi:hypothetical protein
LDVFLEIVIEIRQRESERERRERRGKWCDRKQNIPVIVLAGTRESKISEIMKTKGYLPDLILPQCYLERGSKHLSSQYRGSAEIARWQIGERNSGCFELFLLPTVCFREASHQDPLASPRHSKWMRKRKKGRNWVGK